VWCEWSKTCESCGHIKYKPEVKYGVANKVQWDAKYVFQTPQDTKSLLSKECSN